MRPTKRPTNTPRQRGQHGKSPATLQLIARAKGILERIQPAGVRATCYQLFINKWLRSMKKGDTDKVSKHLVWAREQSTIPWEWIVDETRPEERDPQWTDIAAYLKTVERSYRMDYWRQQPVRIVVVSEKATIGGVLRPILHQYGVSWCYVHGYNSATKVHEMAEASLRDARRCVVLYVGDWDCSGMHMSEADLPRRLLRYGGRVELQRIALIERDVATMGALKFPAKRTDSRYQWFVSRYGTDCWELDALDPTVLRARIEEAICGYIEWGTWERCQLAEAAEKETITGIVRQMIISRQATK